jgi:hypothetical protein
MGTIRIALANIQFPASPEESIAPANSFPDCARGSQVRAIRKVRL